MRLSFGAVILIISSIILSLLLANVAKIISTEAGLYKNLEQIETSDKKSLKEDKKGGYVKVLDDSPKVTSIVTLMRFDKQNINV